MRIHAISNGKLQPTTLGASAPNDATLVVQLEHPAPYLPELLTLSDRILVMREGRLVGELPRADATEEKILALALPGSSNGDKEGSLDPRPQGKDGQNAAVLSLGSFNQQALPADEKLRALYLERQDLERRIDGLKLMKSGMDPQKYSAELERLATELALKTRQIREAEGKR